jgi:hypothetical protein
MVRGVPDNPKYSFDEYKLYYESTEKVTDRRLATNTWNYGLCTAITAAVAGLGNWSTSRPEFALITIGAILMLAGMGTLLCTLWIGQIRDFKALNNAKFDVLSEMAPLVHFGPDDERTSAMPFAREWKILEDKKATEEVQTMRILALRSSNTEFLVPTAFRWLFFLIIVVATTIAVINLPLLTRGLFVLKPAESGGSGPAASPVSQPTIRP